MDERLRHRRTAAREYQRRYACGEGDGKRMSLMEPRFNLREVAKQMILLEDHLQHPYKHCPDCIRKHLMTIEGFAEEATTLDKVGIYHELAEAIADTAREWMERFQDGESLPGIAQEIRKVRKNLVPVVCDPRQAVSRVASRYISSNTVCPHRRAALTG